jgi:hypothetical protein
VEVTEASTKFVDIIVSRRNFNIIYKEFYEENPPLPKIIITKIIINNENKSSYETAMAGPEIY